MSPTEESNLGPLIEALKWYDESSRTDRATRIAWASSLFVSPGLVAAPIVPLNLMEEARVSFVNGQFMATVLSATSVIEHLLVEHLRSNSVPGETGTLAKAVNTARDARLFPPQVLDDIDELRRRRNPFVHKSADGGKRSLYDRYVKCQVHPSVLLEEDARLALRVMYEFFRCVLKPAA